MYQSQPFVGSLENKKQNSTGPRKSSNFESRNLLELKSQKQLQYSITIPA